MLVRFNDLGEFLEELDKDKDAKLAPRLVIVRTAVEYRSEFQGSLSHVSVVAGFLREGGQLVEFRHYCGAVIMGMGPDNKIVQEADELLARLIGNLSQRGVDVRHGVFVEKQ